MKTTFQKILAFLIFLLFVTSVFLMTHFSEPFRFRFFPSRMQTDWNLLVDQAEKNQTDFDARKLDALDWDAMFFIFPYESTDFKKLGFQVPHISSHDDGEMYAVFLKDEKYVSHFPVSRKKVDFTRCSSLQCAPNTDKSPLDADCRCNGIFKKTEAVFAVDYGKAEYRPVQLRPLVK